MGRANQTEKSSAAIEALKKTPKVKEEHDSSKTKHSHHHHHSKSKSDKHVKKEEEKSKKKRTVKKAHLPGQDLTATNLRRFLHHERSWGQKFRLIPWTLFKSITMRALDNRDPYYGGIRRKIHQDTLTIREDARLLLQAHTETFIPKLSREPTEFAASSARQVERH